jgi:hypothetical protein
MSPRQGKPYRLPPLPEKTAEQMESDAQLFGRTWTDGRICLPWADCRGTRRFAVLSPAYGGDILICSFRHDDGLSCQWWHEGLQVGVSGVTHWRLAEEQEHDYWLDPACWPEPGEIGISLKAQRWNWLYSDGPISTLG